MRLRGKELGFAVESHREGAVLSLRVQAGARRSAVIGEHAGALKVAVTAPREKGKANRAVLEVLADALGVKQSELTILSGQTSPAKRVLVRGLDAEALRGRLVRAGAGG